MKMYLIVLAVVCVMLIAIDTCESSIQLGATDPPSRNINLRGRRDTSTDSGSTMFYYQEPKYPRDCKEVYEQCETSTESGVYWIQPDGATEPFTVYCNNSIDGGGWTVIQKRLDGAVDFYRTWVEYKQGFGFKDREFWLGNDKISQLTNQKECELRIDINNQNRIPYVAKYSLFRISDEWSKYRLVGLGEFLPESTVGGDSLRSHYNMSFSTYDRDNDIHSSRSCADYNHGAWWYYNCDHSDLNSDYFQSGEASVEWSNLPSGGHFGLKYSEMKVRPL